MRKFSAEGSFKTVAKFKKSVHLKLANGIEIIFPLSKSVGTLKFFSIKGKCQKNDELYSYLTDLMSSILRWFSFCYEVPVSLSSLNIEIKRSGKPIYLAGMVVRSPFPSESKTKLVDEDKRLNTFKVGTNKILSDPRSALVLDFFSKVINEGSDYAKFWRLYNILQIFIGERPEIDSYLKKNYNFPLVKDNRGVKRTIVVAIRDSFSHRDAKFDGKKLNLDIVLKENLPNMMKVAKDLLKKLLI